MLRAFFFNETFYIKPHISGKTNLIMYRIQNKNEQFESLEFLISFVKILGIPFAIGKKRTACSVDLHQYRVCDMALHSMKYVQCGRPLEYVTYGVWLCTSMKYVQCGSAVGM